MTIGIQFLRHWLCVSENRRCSAVMGLTLVFVAWALFGLVQSPGATLDEVPIADSALSLLNKGYLSVPSAGPGNYHEEAFLYQSPGYPILLAGVFRLLGPGLWQGRLLSTGLAAAVLLCVGTFMLKFGFWPAVTAMTVLATDPLFSSRAREIRWDSLAVLGQVTSWLLLASSMQSSSERVRRLRIALAGFALGVAVLSDVLYVILLPAFLIVCLLFHNRPSQSIKHRLLDCLAFTSGLLVLLPPLLWYVLRHVGAFQDQFLYQVKAHSAPTSIWTQPVQWILEELSKYSAYYRLTPFLLIGSVLSLLIIIRVITQDRKDANILHNINIVRQLGFLAIASPLLLAIASDHRVHHHLLVVPFWAVACGMAVSFATEGDGLPVIVRKATSLLLLVAMLNGVTCSCLARTYCAIQSWGTRDVGRVKNSILSYIPERVAVYGDYRLLFLASSQQWDFVTTYYHLNIDIQRLAEKHFEFLVLSEFTTPPADMRLERYEQIAVIYGTEPPWNLPLVNKSIGRLVLRVFRLR